MSEHLQIQTRTEHSRSLEDAERFKALETLKELGFLIPLTDVDSYHGRVGYENEPEWQVDPAFRNGGNDSGNSNINGRTTLYTSSKEVGEAFAKARGRQIVNRRLSGHFKELAEHYTDEQKQSWAEKETAKRQGWYDALTDEQKASYASEPRVYTVDDFSPAGEVRHLRENMGKEELGEIWQSLSSDMKVEIHEIVSLDTDAAVIDEKFSASELNEDEQSRYFAALNTLALAVTEGAPLDFNDRHTLTPMIASVKEHEFSDFLSTDDVAALASKSGVSETTVKAFAGALNTRALSRVNPKFLVREFLRSTEDIIEVSDEDGKTPLSISYIESWLRQNHIVGIKQGVKSATLGETITSISLFDLHKATTKEGLEKKMRKIQKTMGSIASSFEGEIDGDEHLLRLLEDAHAKPKALVDAAKEVEGFQEIFDMDAGNWEGFTLAEHTETVLDNFEQNYADELPVSMLAPMRLIILAHDIGKPIASQDGRKQDQSVYNVKYATEFFQKLGIDTKMSALMVSVLGDGAKLAFDIDVRKKGAPAEAKIDALADATMTEFYGEKPTEAQKSGYIEMCRMLQICDGGAYTTMGVTRRRQGIGRYRNAPSFQGSFESPVGLGKRDIKLKK